MANAIGTTDVFGQTSGSANREDLIDLITLTDPFEHPFLTMVSKGTATAKQHEWLTSGLQATATGGGSIHAEGAAFSGDVINTRTRLWNLAEIFRKDIDVSNTQRTVRSAGVGDEYLNQIDLAAKEVARDIEVTLLQGVAGSATGTSGAGTTMKTIQNFVSTNSFSTSSTAIGATGVGFSTTSWALGELMFNGVLEQVYFSGGRVDTVFVNGPTKRQISRFGVGVGPAALGTSGPTSLTRRTIDANSKTLVMSVDRFVTDFGAVDIILDRWVGTTEGGQGQATPNPANNAHFLQMDTWQIAFLRPIKHVPLPPGGDSVRGMVLGELTLVNYAEQWNGLVSNLATRLTPTSDGTVTS